MALNLRGLTVEARVFPWRILIHREFNLPLGSLAVLFNSSAQASIISWWPTKGFTPNDHKTWSSNDATKMVRNEFPKALRLRSSKTSLSLSVSGIFFARARV
jgi:hypothetical protein